MEQITRTYTVTIERGDVWQFKYNLNGVLVYYDVMKGDLSKEHEEFLFIKGKFPWKEDQIKNWGKKNTKILVEVGEPDLSFERFHKKVYPYNPLSKKKIALERWQKLTKEQLIKIFQKTPEFIRLKNKEGTAFPYLEVYIKAGWWDQ
ncbi:hypothetical protein ACSV4D_09370 [Flavobacterium sp. ARAG 55.4]|uniref:hypothetical protein n=1 Tax=Flavobacterium sp. ARAG 55.4 TaxID=3451357 RepID=UPI003F48ABD0